VSKIDYVNFQVVNTYPAPGGPDCLEVSGDGKLLFISSRWIGKVTVVDLESAKVIRQIKVGKSPHGIWTLDHAKRQ